MPSASETIIVVEPLADDDVDWEGNPTPGATRAERPVTGCLLIPRMSPDDPTIVMDGYQVLMMDPSQIPPAAEDGIKIRGGSKIWDIDGNVGDVRKPSGDVRVYQFVIESPR